MDFWSVTQSLLQGFGVTCIIFIITLIFALPLGLVISFGSMSKFKPLSFIVKIFVWIIRGIPLMLQVFIVYYMVKINGVNLWGQVNKFFYFELGWSVGPPELNGEGYGGLIAVLIAFIINYACYFSEIFRGGISSIQKGQYEAGAVLGMTKTQVFFKVVLIQVIKHIVPPMGNEIITLVKDTSIARMISLVELTDIAFDLRKAQGGGLWPLLAAGLFYYVFNAVVAFILKMMLCPTRGCSPIRLAEFR